MEVSPHETYIQTNWEMITYTPQIAHAVISATWTETSIEWFGLRKDIIFRNPGSLLCKVKFPGRINK